MRRVSAVLVVSLFLSFLSLSAQTRHRRAIVPVDPTQAVKAPAATSPWTPLNNQPTFLADVALLMTDGTVLVHEECSPNWHKLTPDLTGSYISGTWSTVAAMQAGYGPLYFSTAVLADGRLVAIGGEANVTSNCSSDVMTNLGAIYNPKTNTWAPLAGPGWSQIGDAENIVLPNGQFMLANFANGQVALLNPATLTWSSPSSAGKADRNDEEGWALLPNGTVLVTNVQAAPGSQIFNPATGAWTNAGNTGTVNVTAPSSQEIGPILLRPDGTVIQFGANGNNAIYNTTTGAWSNGPVFPATSNGQLAAADAPAALLPSGNVLVAASVFIDGSDSYPGGTSYFEFDGTNLNPVGATPAAPAMPSFVGRMLLLPTGQVLNTAESTDIEIYTPTGSPNPAWAPAITTAPSAISSGQTYSITGTQFNGLSQAVAYGDDAQAATNYPLVRVTMTATGHVFYCRTHDHSTMGVATGTTPVSTSFDVPAGTESGAATLQVVANGIASTGVAVSVAGAAANAVTVTTSPAGLAIIVDGTTYTAPQTFSWTVGSSHTLNVTSPQNGTTGTRYAWTSWSQGGAQSQNVTPTSGTTYTANFTTEYLLTTSASPTAGGTVTPSPACPSGCYYNSGTVVTLTAKANSGYTFTSWSNGVTSNPTSVTMIGPQTITANFTVPPISVTVSTSPAGRQIVVDGTTYTAPQTFSWTPKSSHTLNVASPQSGGTGIQYAWSSWSQGGAQSQSVSPSSGTTYTASFNTQYQLTTAVTPAASGTVSPSCIGGCFYTSGTKVSVTATAASGYTFSSWSGGLTGNPTSVTMSAPQTVTATFTATAPPLAFTVTSSPAGRSVTVDGTAYTTPHTFSWVPGSSHTLNVTSPQSGGTGTQYVFGSWSDAGAQSHTITAPSASTTYTANFTTQYLLTTAITPSHDGSVTPSCTNGCYYNSGAVVTLTATPRGGHTFVSWSGGLTGNPAKVTITAPITVTATFK